LFAQFNGIAHCCRIRIRRASEWTGRKPPSRRGTSRSRRPIRSNRAPTSAPGRCRASAGHGISAS